MPDLAGRNQPARPIARIEPRIAHPVLNAERQHFRAVLDQARADAAASASCRAPAATVRDRRSAGEPSESSIRNAGMNVGALTNRKPVWPSIPWIRCAM